MTAALATPRGARTSERLLAPAILESHIGILGKTGSGKSNLAKTIVEGLLDEGARVCVIDPTGTWYGLRLTRDRKPSPYQVVMFGGTHADIAIGRTHGAAVAETIGTTSTPAVIDTRTMTVGERTEFFTGFAETLLQRNRGPLHLVVDEAHLFAPQGRVADPKSGAMVHAANNLVSLGRGIGLRIILISQRPAKLHKDSLTQVETLIAMRLIAPQDRRAIEDWIGEWADPKQGAELVSSLPSLPTGDAWIWAPGENILRRFHAPLAATLDTGKPSGEPIELGHIDIAAVQERLGQVAADVLANDPRELRRRIAELERQLRDRPAGEPERIVERVTERVEVPALSGEQIDALRLAAQSTIAAADSIETVASEILGKLDWLERPTSAPRPAPVIPAPVGAEPGPAHGKPDRGRTEAPPSSDPAARESRSEGVSGSGASREPGEVRLDAGARRMLSALASLHPTGLTKVQLGTLVDLPAKGSTFRTYLSQLRSGGLITAAGSGIELSSAGIERMRDEIGGPVPTTAELVEMWGRKLDRGARLMLGALVNAYPRGLSKDELADVVAIPAAGSTFRTYLSKIRSNQLIEEANGTIRAGEALFLGGGR